MSDRIRVAIVDDHPLFREGVIHVLKSCPEIEVIDQGASADDAEEIARQRKPDVLVLDVSIPGSGLSALEAIAASSPETRVLILTVSVDRTDILKALQLGARGYIVKGVSGIELLQALQAVHRGDRYVSPSLGAMLLSDIDHGKPAPKARPVEALSHREDEVLALVRRGLSNKEIGSRLSLSDKTVKHYMTSVFQKLRVRNRVEAAMLMAGGPPAEALRVE